MRPRSSDRALAHCIFADNLRRVALNRPAGFPAAPSGTPLTQPAYLGGLGVLTFISPGLSSLSQHSCGSCCVLRSYVGTSQVYSGSAR